MVLTTGTDDKSHERINTDSVLGIKYCFFSEKEIVSGDGGDGEECAMNNRKEKVESSVLHCTGLRE